MKKILLFSFALTMVSILLMGCKSTNEDSNTLIVTETVGADETQQTSESISTTTEQVDSTTAVAETATETTAAETTATETTATETTATETTVTEATVTEETEATISDADKAKLFPTDFELSNGKGQMISLSDHKGKLLFLNFFTTWCGYCMDEMPEFQKAYETYAEDLEIIIVDVNFDSGEKSIEEVVKWYEDAGYTFPMVIDEDGVKTEAFYPYVQGYPTTFVYGPDGGFIGYLSGALDEATITQIVEQYKVK